MDMRSLSTYEEREHRGTISTRKIHEASIIAQEVDVGSGFQPGSTESSS